MRAHTAALATALILSCKYDPSYRDIPLPLVIVCTEGKVTCLGDVVSECKDNAWLTVRDCNKELLRCAGSPPTCLPCVPGSLDCSGQTVTQCSDDGQKRVDVKTCDQTQGLACRDGSCHNLCADADQEHSNIGCEVWGADLDNAVISAAQNAAAQQYAIVVSNAEPDVKTDVIVEQDDALVGQPAQLRTMAKATILPGNL